MAVLFNPGCVLDFPTLAVDGKEELQSGSLSQLATCIQCYTDYVCYDRG